MKQYLDLLRKVLNDGVWVSNRTGIPTIRIDGAMLQFKLSDGFPAVTTKKLAFKAVVGELLGFIRGYDNAAGFRKLGCKVWDQNANENEAWLKNQNRKGVDDLGRIYGRQWRAWSIHTCGRIDQLQKAIDTIIKDPYSRRNIVTAWNPGELDQMALPPCHMMFQFIVDPVDGVLSMCMYQRSCDMFLGIPFNIASYALLLELVAAVTNLKAGTLTMFLADVHIYKNHIEQVMTQLAREPYDLPELVVDEAFFARGDSAISNLEKAEPSDFSLINYFHHEAINGDMAV